MSDDRMVQVMVRMPPEMLAALKREAKAEDRTVAQTVRRALKLYLARPKENQ